ncbi:MAG: radical SAM protein [Spirochaetes bacterium]|nr:radical SAM protein [Spirochaetota bacterium]
MKSIFKDIDYLFQNKFEQILKSNSETLIKNYKYIREEWKNPFGLDYNYLKEEAKLFYERLKNCDICPNECKVNRIEGEKGFCGQTADLKISSYNLHFGEEPFISGKNGSGTIFFTGCSLKCIFCQNYPISQLNNGVNYSIEKLQNIFLKLQNDHAHNINLVTPTHFAPHIYLAFLLSKLDGFNLPVAYNNSGYEKIEIIDIIKNFTDIFIYDVKYGDDELAYKFSGIKNYTKYNFEGLKYLVNIYGDQNIYGFDQLVRKDCSLECNNCYNPVHEVIEATFENNEIETDNLNETIEKSSFKEGKMKKIKVLKRGIVLRHLIIPAHIENSFKVIDFISNISKNLTIGLMNQYFPAYKASIYKKDFLDRRLTEKEYDKVINYALKKGLKNILLQI